MARTQRGSPRAARCYGAALAQAKIGWQAGEVEIEQASAPIASMQASTWPTVAVQLAVTLPMELSQSATVWVVTSPEEQVVVTPGPPAAATPQLHSWETSALLRSTTRLDAPRPEPLPPSVVPGVESSPQPRETTSAKRQMPRRTKG